MNDFIDKLPKLIAAISFASIIAFVVYEWSYFFVIGPRFLLLFTAYDFISSAIIWIIPSSIIIIISLLFEFLPIIDYTKPNFSFLRRSIEFFAAIVAVVVLLGYWTGLLFVACFICFMLVRLSNWIIQKYEIDKRIEPSILQMTIVIGLLIIMAGGFGYDMAYFDLRLRATEYSIEVKGEDVRKNEEVEVLRIIERGMIVLDRKSKRVKYIPSSQILSLKKVMPEPNPETLLCSWFNLGCR